MDYELGLTTNGLGYILGDLKIKLSGHPAADPFASYCVICSRNTLLELSNTLLTPSLAKLAGLITDAFLVIVIVAGGWQHFRASSQFCCKCQSISGKHGVGEKLFKKVRCHFLALKSKLPNAKMSKNV
jgi:hypothetical protein